LELDQPRVFLRQAADGQWNVATLIRSQETAPAQPPPARPTPTEAPVRNWKIDDGTLVIERAGEPTLQLSGIEFEAYDLSLASPFSFRLAVGFSPESSVSAQGRLGPVDVERLARTRFSGTVDFEQFQPAVLSSLVAVPPELARLGALDGSATVESTQDELSLAGRIDLLGAQAQDRVRLELNARLPLGGGRATLEGTALEFRGARLVATGSLPFASKGELDLAVNTADADLEALRQLPVRLGQSLPFTVPPVAGKLRADLKLAGTPSDLRVTGTASFRELTLPLEPPARPLRLDALELTLEPNRIEAAPFTVSPQPGFTLSVVGSIEDYRLSPRLQARLTGEDIPVAPLLALAARFGVAPLGEGHSLEGRLSPALDLDGPLAELSELRYQGSLAFRDMTFSTPQLPEPVRVPVMTIRLTPAQVSAQPFTVDIGQRLRAQVGFQLADYRRRPALSARLTTQGADLAALLGLARSLGTDPLPGGRAAGKISATLDLRGPVGENTPPLKISGEAQLQDVILRPVTLTAPLAIEQAQLKFAPDRFTVSGLRLQAAGATVQGNLQAQNFDAPRVSFHFEGDRLDVAALQALFGAARPAAQAFRSWFSLPVVHARKKSGDWFAKLSGRGQLAFEQVTHGTLMLAPFRAPVAIANRVLTCDPIEFGLYGGGGRGRLVVDLRCAEPLTEFEGLLRNVDADELLSANSDAKNRLQGRLGGRLKARFAGSERPRILQSARGQGQLTLSQGRMMQMNLSRELVTVSKLTGLSFDRRDTPVEDMSSEFEVADGWGRTQELAILTPELAIAAVGGFSLQDELAFEATATFTPEASQQLKGRGPLGALAGEVFTDEQGRVVVPFNIAGTFARPSFKLDAKRLLEMKMGRGRQREGSSGFLGDIIDRLRKRKKRPQ
ncbi:MAG: AsmA-like C-terminal region-containing protein, partial [Terriglobia bacterium]